MTGNNKFWKGMLLGAIAGGAISLLDKQTRQAMKENVQKVANIVRHPGEITDRVKETAAKVRTAMEKVSEDISFIVDKVDELREFTPQVTDMIKETKDTFTKGEEDDQYLLNKDESF